MTGAANGLTSVATALDAGDIGRLLIRCRDQPGIVAAVAGFVRDQGGNILELDQFSVDSERTLFQRTEFSVDQLQSRIDKFGQSFGSTIARQFAGMDWRVTQANVPKRIVLFVSRLDACPVDILWRCERGEINADVVAVIGNHHDLERAIEPFGVPFYYTAITRETRPEAEGRQLELISRYGADLVVLARYMQILSGNFLSEANVPIINIHHSFLPAFVGAGPYAKAVDRGVKLVGATAHYVTEDLDEGPIIEQDVVRVSHRDGVDQLTRKGADVERLVLSRAVHSHCEDRVARFGNKTVVF